MNRETTRAIMIPFGQRFLDSFAALAAFLACATGINFDEQRTGTFSLVAQLPKELSPSCIQDVCGQTAPNHSGNIEFFDRYQLMGIDDLPALFMSKTPSLVGDASVKFLQTAHGFPSVTTAFGFSAHSAIGVSKFANRLPKMPWVYDLFPIGERGERFESNVDADCRTNWNDRHTFNAILDDELTIPFAGLENDSLLFDLANEVTHIANTHAAIDSADADSIADKYGFAWIKNAETIPAIRTFESRESRFADAFPESPEEVFVGSVQSAEYVALNIDRDTGEHHAQRSELGEISTLAVVAKCFAGLFVIPDALLKGMIVENSADVQQVLQSRSLRTAWITAIVHGSQHVVILSELTD